MTIEITLLPISCRTLHKSIKFLLKIIANILVWAALICGIFIMISPRYIQTISTSNRHLSDNTILFCDYGIGICLISVAILLMTILYDIKINLCIKEKSE